MALEGVVQFAPMIQLSAQINGDTELKVWIESSICLQICKCMRTRMHVCIFVRDFLRSDMSYSSISILTGE